MIRGSCLCGAVRYEAEGPLTDVFRCHCTQCQKASGSEFGVAGSVPARTFRVVTGEPLLRAFEWSPGQARVFCSQCGSPLFKRRADHPEVIRLRLGTLDEGIDTGPEAHIWVSERPAWSSVTDHLPQHARART